ncbi:hypothetical protein D3C87_1361080 [compost metagenome]
MMAELMERYWARIADMLLRPAILVRNIIILNAIRALQTLANEGNKMCRFKNLLEKKIPEMMDMLRKR